MPEQQQIPMQKFKEWIAELYLEKKALEMVIQAQAEEISKLKEPRVQNPETEAKE